MYRRFLHKTRLVGPATSFVFKKSMIVLVFPLFFDNHIYELAQKSQKLQGLLLNGGLKHIWLSITRYKLALLSEALSGKTSFMRNLIEVSINQISKRPNLRVSSIAVASSLYVLIWWIFRKLAFFGLFWAFLMKH